MPLFTRKNIYTALVSALLLSLCCPRASAQREYILYLADKNHSTFSLDQPAYFLSERSLERRVRQGIPLTPEDLPVSEVYIDSLRRRGLSVRYVSKWLNACLVEGDSYLISEIALSGFVSHVDSMDIRRGISTLDYTTSYGPVYDYGTSGNQLAMHQIPRMHEEGLTGRGMLIAVLDAGFKDVDRIAGFRRLFDNNAIVATYDFPAGESNVYDDHEHGTRVLSVLAAYDPGKLIGTAFGASYALLRTENVQIEAPIEEFYWLLAAELADSLGADIISSSLGYNVFDNASLNYSYEDMDGRSTLITIAAEKAFSKGMLVVNSVGNDGDTPWKHLIAPADGRHVLAVGAVDHGGQFYSISGRGPSADGRIKPDVVAVGRGARALSSSGALISVNGTSYATPIISGFAANLWQRQPDLSNLELLQKIRELSSQAENPDNNMGYGIPMYDRTAGLPDPLDERAVISNPVFDFIHFINPPFDSFRLIVVDLRGNRMIDVVRDDVSSFDVSALSSGVYIVLMEGKDMVYRQALIKR